MAKAQLENGYTMIAHEIIEKVCSMQLTTNEFRIFLAIVRLSYGWRQKTTGERASGDALSEMTKLRRDKVYSAIRALKSRKLIFAQATNTANEYRINTEIAKWSNRPESGAPRSGSPESGQSIDPSQGKNHPESGQSIDPSRVYATTATPAPEAGRQTPKDIKDIKDIKDRKDREILPHDYYQKTLKALGLPATAILSPLDQKALQALLEVGCTFEDIEQARIKRKKNRLEWIQDTVCEMRDARAATATKLDKNGVLLFPDGRMDWDNMTFEQKQNAIQLGYSR